MGSDSQDAKHESEQKMEGICAKFQILDKRLEDFLRVAQIDNTSSTILDLTNVEAITTLYKLALQLWEMRQLWAALCRPYILHPDSLYPLVSRESLYNKMWNKTCRAAKIILKRLEEAGDYGNNIRAANLDNGETIISVISISKNVANGINGFILSPK